MNTRRSKTLLVQDKSLEEVLEDLPCVHDFQFDPLLPVGGESFLECFAGGCVVTLAILWCQVPAFRPWDIDFGDKYDVVRYGHLIFSFISLGSIAMAHFGTPCTSMTWARQPQLRAPFHLFGLPHLSWEQRRLVDDGNSLVAFTVKCCWLLKSVQEFSVWKIHFHLGCG